jgi:hypothetical protein
LTPPRYSTIEVDETAPNDHTAAAAALLNKPARIAPRVISASQNLQEN